MIQLHLVAIGFAFYLDNYSDHNSEKFSKINYLFNKIIA